MKKWLLTRNYKYLIIINVFVLLCEIIFSIFTYKNFTIYTFLFSIFNSLLFFFIFNIFRSKKLYIIMLIILTIIYISNLIYYYNYNTFIELNIMIKSLSVFKYYNVILDTIKNNFKMVLLIIPFILSVLLIHKIKIYEDSLKPCSLYLILSYFIVSIFLIVTSNSLYSPKSLYYQVNIPSLNLYNFGLLTSIRLDAQRSIFGFKEKTINIESNNNSYDKNGYNILDLDFKDTNNEKIIEINKYISNNTPTEKNIYTNMLSNKNLIFILAESFNTIAIDKEITPNIYKLFNEGFVFNNFYNPLFPVSTADGQYLTDISLYPSDIVHSLTSCNNNYYPYSLANIFKNLNYKTYSFHNYDYDFYERDKYYSNMGFDDYKAINKGLDLSYNSDYEMALKSVDDYINEDKFFVYYLTYSGHALYNMNNKNVSSNIDKVKGNYSSHLKYYLSTQIELDNMIKYLFDRLEETNKLDDTLIVLLPDHTPHSLNEKEFSEKSPYNVYDEFDIYKSSMVFYNKKLNKYKSSNNYCSNIDVLPTLLNLFGIEYDSRLLMGRDILSNNDGKVIFGNRNIISKDFKYSNHLQLLTGNSNMSLDEIKEDSYLKFRISRLILENDYYRYLFKQ